MLYVVGLGNKGEEYKENRHNTGRIIVELITKPTRQNSGGKSSFTGWKEDSKLKALMAKGEIENEKITFILPNNFMNNSGKSVAPLIKSKKDLDKLVVIYDDLDLPIGKIKLSFNRSSGGHNGLGSIIKCVKSEAFLRIRVGVSPHTPSGKTKKPKGEKSVLEFLLKDFKEPEMKEIKKITKTISEVLVCISAESKEKAMSIFNQ